MEYFTLIFCFFISLFITPLVKRIAFKLKAVDHPNDRKVHEKIMPRLGGLSIYGGFITGITFFFPNNPIIWPIIIGGTIIVILGMIDDIYQLSAKVKLIGQLLVAVTVIIGGVQIEFLTIPFGPRIDFGVWSIPITVIWIVGVTNAINLIDGLDGLASGVSAIALLTISGMAITIGNSFVLLMGLIMLGSTLGFLMFNFYPAKIFLGDTGSLFLGYMISVLSILGLFKNVTVISIIIPIVILGVPLVDTFFAIIRRFVQGKPLSAPDKLHLHHCLLRLGYSHRKSVLLIYGISGIFSLAAIVFTKTTMWGSILIILLLTILIELIVEVTGLINQNYRPVLNLLRVYRARR